MLTHVRNFAMCALLGISLVSCASTSMLGVAYNATDAVVNVVKVKKAYKRVRASWSEVKESVNINTLDTASKRKVRGAAADIDEVLNNIKSVRTKKNTVSKAVVLKDILSMRRTLVRSSDTLREVLQNNKDKVSESEYAAYMSLVDDITTVAGPITGIDLEHGLSQHLKTLESLFDGLGIFK